MLKGSQIQKYSQTTKTLLPRNHPLIAKEKTILQIPRKLTNFSGLGNNNSHNNIPRPRGTKIFGLFGNIENALTGIVEGVEQGLTEIAETVIQKDIIKATVTVQKTILNAVSIIGGAVDVLPDLFGLSFYLELVAADLDPKTGKEKARVGDFARQVGLPTLTGVYTYEADFVVPKDFGPIGAVVVENQHVNEAFVKDIVIPEYNISISCQSFVHSKLDNDEKRVFFTNKLYLPNQTPSGLATYRENELKILRGELRKSTGEFQKHERIYDYDVYNDLGVPKSNPRPILGGKELPYPRRGKTNRAKTSEDPLTETRSLLPFYVPRDENFSELKTLGFGGNGLYSVLHAVVPNLKSVFTSFDFPYFTTIDELFNEGVNLPGGDSDNLLLNILPSLFKPASNAVNNVLKFETPELIDRDKFSWFRDEEFARQALAGLHPSAIELVKEWPLKSKLDSAVYGAPESAITQEIVDRELKGYMTLQEAIAQKRLYVIDYHDLLLPHVNKVREIEGTTLYASRTLFFLTPEGMLKPVAIELVRPKGTVNGKQHDLWKQVFTPCIDATSSWVWRFAKAHFIANDAWVHQTYSHWLRTHCATEPYILAANRQLSAMHPIYRLLHPHFRYTMEINALARLLLINADGLIESTFAPRDYAITMSSDAYDQLWRFDHEGLPANLINRGMAEADPKSPHGVKLTIEDYPYANDGLVVWDAIKEWVTNFVNHYYPQASLVVSDNELQAWWTEVRTVGHQDKKDEPWWPVLKTPQDLIEIATTIIWVASGHHAAVNFGQYDFAGYFPNRPSIARTKMPTEDPTEEERKEFLERPESVLMKCFPSQFQATATMAVLDVLSNHSPEEEYLGNIEPFWEEDAIIKAAFDKFNGRLKELEGIIDARNADEDLKHRTGAGIMPYTLLKPSSEPGVTGQGIPTSVSI